jgi:hypothetical protein
MPQLRAAAAVDRMAVAVDRTVAAVADGANS